MIMVYGTSNQNKLNDIIAIIKAHGEKFNVLSLRDIGFNQEIEENGETFEENSEIKATAVKKFCDVNNIKYDLITTDDAGLCVECLNGEPGVYSARYAGNNATQEQCLNKLLKNIELTGVNNREAKFVCVLTSFLKDGTKIVSRGECIGTVAKEFKKLGGLTYAPIFIPEGYEVPMAELSAQDYEKAHNHRDKAFCNLMEQLRNI